MDARSTEQGMLSSSAVASSRDGFAAAAVRVAPAPDGAVLAGASTGAEVVVACIRHTPTAMPITAITATSMTTGLFSGNLGAAVPATISVPSSVN